MKSRLDKKKPMFTDKGASSLLSTDFNTAKKHKTLKAVAQVTFWGVLTIGGALSVALVAKDIDRISAENGMKNGHSSRLLPLPSANQP